METQPGLELRKFVAPEILFGVGARQLVGQYVRNFNAKKVMIVTDPGVVAAGWVDQAIKSLRSAHVSYTVYDNVRTNPLDTQVMEGGEYYRRHHCDVILAIGGGSPMDCAKGIGIVFSNKSHVSKFKGIDEVANPGPPLICIPTTAGSSADVSQFSIITDTTQKLKFAIVSKTVVPDLALIDPETTITMNQYLTASTGMDALVHAIEAYVSNASSPLTDLHALEAIRLIAANLLSAISSLSDLNLRTQMMLASLHAGLAFSNASLGAVHAMAHSLGGYLDTFHGESNALLLSAVINVNYEACPDRYNTLGKIIGLALEKGKEKEQICRALDDLHRKAGLEHSLTELGLKSEDIPLLAERAINDPCMVTNPRKLTLALVEKIYEATR